MITNRAISLFCPKSLSTEVVALVWETFSSLLSQFLHLSKVLPGPNLQVVWNERQTPGRIAQKYLFIYKHSFLHRNRRTVEQRKARSPSTHFIHKVSINMPSHDMDRYELHCCSYGNALNPGPISFFSNANARFT